MGCCYSDLEVSLSDLQPLGICAHFARAYRHHCDMTLSMRNTRRLHDHIRRLTRQRHQCTRQIAKLQIEIRAQAQNRDAHDRDGDSILKESCEREIQRMRKSALRLMSMRSLIDHFERNMHEESVGIDLLMTLDSVAHTPFVRLSPDRLSKLILEVQHRTALTREQSAMFDTLLRDLDEYEVEAEGETEVEAERAIAISPSDRADLERLAEISVPQTL